MPSRLLLIVVLMFAFVGITVAAEPDWSDYERLLKAHVTQGVSDGVPLAQVDYPAIRISPLWPKVVNLIEQYPVEHLANRDERLSFYINAYNILAIKMVIDHWPVESIKDAGSLFSPVWKKTVGHIGGNAVTLDEIEHRILRPMGEPRIHFAIVCASVSCPDLLDEPYMAPKLDQQLDDQTRHFLNNSAKGLRVDGNRLRVSKIFDWFEKDFEQAGGIEPFVRRYRDDLPKGLSLRTNIPYDWNLNSEIKDGK